MRSLSNRHFFGAPRLKGQFWKFEDGSDAALCYKDPRKTGYASA